MITLSTLLEQVTPTLPELADIGNITVKLSEVVPIMGAVIVAIISVGGTAFFFLHRTIGELRKEVKKDIDGVWQQGVDPLRADLTNEKVKVATLTTRMDSAKQATREYSSYLLTPRRAREKELLRQWSEAGDVIEMRTSDLRTLRAMCTDLLRDPSTPPAEKAVALTILRQVEDELVVRESRTVETNRRLRLVAAENGEEDDVTEVIDTTDDIYEDQAT